MLDTPMSIMGWQEEILHYIKCEKVPSWVERVHLFMDNAGSTNKNQYQMGAAMEIMQQNLLDIFSYKLYGSRSYEV